MENIENNKFFSCRSMERLMDEKESTKVKNMDASITGSFLAKSSKLFSLYS